MLDPADFDNHDAYLAARSEAVNVYMTPKPVNKLHVAVAVVVALIFSIAFVLILDYMGKTIVMPALNNTYEFVITPHCWETNWVPGGFQPFGLETGLPALDINSGC